MTIWHFSGYFKSLSWQVLAPWSHSAYQIYLSMAQVSGLMCPLLQVDLKTSVTQYTQNGVRHIFLPFHFTYPPYFPPEFLGWIIPCYYTICPQPYAINLKAFFACLFLGYISGGAQGLLVALYSDCARGAIWMLGIEPKSGVCKATHLLYYYSSPQLKGLSYLIPHTQIPTHMWPSLCLSSSYWHTWPCRFHDYGRLANALLSGFTSSRKSFCTQMPLFSAF